MMEGLVKEQRCRGNLGETRNQPVAERIQEEEEETDYHSTLNQEEHQDWKVVREKNSIQLHCKTCKVMESLLQISREDWSASLHCSSLQGSDWVHWYPRDSPWQHHCCQQTSCLNSVPAAEKTS